MRIRKILFLLFPLILLIFAFSSCRSNSDLDENISTKNKVQFEFVNGNNGFWEENDSTILASSESFDSVKFQDNDISNYLHLTFNIETKEITIKYVKSVPDYLKTINIVLLVYKEETLIQKIDFDALIHSFVSKKEAQLDVEPVITSEDIRYFEFLDTISFPFTVAEWGTYEGVDGYYCTTFGTAWISKKIEDKDYSYYMATNYHVVSSYFENYSEEKEHNPLIGFGLKRNDNEGFKYFGFRNFNFINDDNSGMFDFSGTEDGVSSTINSIDLSIIKVDFSYWLGKSDDEANLDSLFSRLDKINEKCLDGGSVFNGVVHDYVSPTYNNPNYIGGFPYSYQDGGQVSEHHKFVDGQKQVLTSVKDNLKKLEPHPIDGGDTNYIDTSPLATFGKRSINDWMSGGSSGSVVINNKFQIVGIYWGGYNISDKEINLRYFIPCASMIPESLDEYLI